MPAWRARAVLVRSAALMFSGLVVLVLLSYVAVSDRRTMLEEYLFELGGADKAPDWTDLPAQAPYPLSPAHQEPLASFLGSLHRKLRVSRMMRRAVHPTSLRKGLAHRRYALPPRWARNESILFAFALLTDTHVWAESSGRREFVTRVARDQVRDGLLVEASPMALGATLGELAKFAAAGGAFGVHAGDAVCGGASFSSPSEDYEIALGHVAQAERAALGQWPIHHVAGNHDLHPTQGGLASWSLAFRNVSGGAAGAAYRSIRRQGWRMYAACYPPCAAFRVLRFVHASHFAP